MRRHLSVANVVAMLALFAALGAGAFAAGLPKNSVKSKQIKDGGVANRDLKADAVVGAKVADGALTGADVGDDSVLGSEIAEAALQGVTAASTQRVGGLEVKPIAYQVAAESPARSIVDFRDIFRIDASCSTGGDKLDITAFTAVDNSKISIVGSFVGFGDDTDGSRSISSAVENDLDSNEAFAVDNNLPTTSLRQHAVVQFSTPAGFVATAKFATEELGTGCKITGTVIGG